MVAMWNASTHGSQSAFDMSISLELVIAGLVGLVIGYAVALFGRGRASAKGKGAASPDWWELRKGLSGTQLQILKHMESARHTNIGELQEKFSFIPDRELYYRLEQIVLMSFISREHAGGEVTYALNADYAGTVEQDRTLMLSERE
jgi:hypothetical protein